MLLPGVPQGCSPSLDWRRDPIFARDPTRAVEYHEELVERSGMTTEVSASVDGQKSPAAVAAEPNATEVTRCNAAEALDQMTGSRRNRDYPHL